jgi:acetyl esterase
MPLKPDVEQFLRDLPTELRFPADADADGRVAYLERMRAAPRAPGSGEPVQTVREFMVGDVPSRAYIPAGQGPRPILVYFHGGGWVLGDLDMHDTTCRRLANGAECIVVNVGYRLAPEHPFPAPLEDCARVVRWASDNAAEIDGDAQRLAVAGSSSGGNLAAAVCLKARDEGGPKIGLQVLIYPVLDSSMESASFTHNATGRYLESAQMAWYWEQYLPDPSRRADPLASPSHANDLIGLPAAIIVTAEYDPLRDEAEDFGRRLLAAGVDAEVTRYSGQIHGFMGLFGVFADADLALVRLAASLRDRWSSPVIAGRAACLNAADRVELHELASRYGDLIDERDWEGLSRVFTDDCVFDVTSIGGPRLESLDQLRQFLADAPTMPVGHHITNVYVEERPEGVRLRSRVAAVLEDGTRSGSYSDEVVRTDVGWRVTARNFQPRRPPDRGGLRPATSRARATT